MFKCCLPIISCLTLLPLAVVSEVRAADSCSLSTVLQPAIDAAATEATCNADGAYISGQVLADAITNKCNKAKNVERCRKCVKEERDKDFELVKNLYKQGLFRRDDALAVKKAFEGLKVSSCGALPPADPTPPADGTPPPGDNHEPGANPTPGATPPPTGTSRPEEIGAQLGAACQCQGKFTSHDAYLACASHFLGEKVTGGIITKDRAYEIYFYVQKNNCGTLPPPPPPPTPSSNPI